MGRRARGRATQRSGGGSESFCVLWKSWRSFRLPTRQWACTPPPRSTSVPVTVPLTEASAQLDDNRLSREVNQRCCPVRFLRVGDRQLMPIGRVRGRSVVALHLPWLAQSTRGVLQRPGSPPLIDRIQRRHQALRLGTIVLVKQIWLDLASRQEGGAHHPRFLVSIAVPVDGAESPQGHPNECRGRIRAHRPVSYTHLTLPTILRV